MATARIRHRRRGSRHVLLLQDRFGPCLVRTSRLKAYLVGTAAPDHVVRATGPGGVAGVHENARWTSATSFAFELSCCGTTERKEFRFPR